MSKYHKLSLHLRTSNLNIIFFNYININFHQGSYANIFFLIIKIYEQQIYQNKYSILNSISKSGIQINVQKTEISHTYKYSWCGSTIN